MVLIMSLIAVSFSTATRVANSSGVINSDQWEAPVNREVVEKDVFDSEGKKFEPEEDWMVGKDWIPASEPMRGGKLEGCSGG
jgi:hypothetical protein